MILAGSPGDWGSEQDPAYNPLWVRVRSQTPGEEARATPLALQATKLRRERPNGRSRQPRYTQSEIGIARRPAMSTGIALTVWGCHSPGEPAEPLQRERVVSNFPGSALSRAIEVPDGRHVPGKVSQGWSLRGSPIRSTLHIRLTRRTEVRSAATHDITPKRASSTTSSSKNSGPSWRARKLANGRAPDPPATDPSVALPRHSRAMREPARPDRSRGRCCLRGPRVRAEYRASGFDQTFSTCGFPGYPDDARRG
jgi:hypothetical protein